jgi:hypothetical protein
MFMKTKGQGLIEYALLMVLVAVLVIVILASVPYWTMSTLLGLLQIFLWLLGAAFVGLVVFVIVRWDWVVFKFFTRNKSGDSLVGPLDDEDDDQDARRTR